MPNTIPVPAHVAAFHQPSGWETLTITITAQPFADIEDALAGTTLFESEDDGSFIDPKLGDYLRLVNVSDLQGQDRSGTYHIVQGANETRRLQRILALPREFDPDITRPEAA